jgi:FAD/FMN-containing dehydrogenase
VERQGLPGHILGVPRSQLWKVMQFVFNDPGIKLLNTLKFQSARFGHQKPYLQSHVAFAFLLDYVPNWRLAYGHTGFIQYQIFVPNAEARQCFRDVLELCQREGMCSYLGVLKRHRPDAYLLSHALDGWSLALDFRVTAGNRDKLWAMTHRLTERVLAAKGKFYFAKDSVLRPADVAEAYGRERLDKFVALKQRLDPNHALSNDLWARISGTQPSVQRSLP